ncbi:MAG TPA: hypothetical protein VKY89_01630 [Thermoanaerobaculia bacterium]|nr:hypothetical protein [Thermoanaerobaculia bacterium]
MAFEFSEGAQPQVRRAVERAEAQVKPEDIHEIEHRVFEVFPVKLLCYDRLEERLCLLRMAQGFEKSRREKRGAERHARPVVERPQAFRLRKDAEGVRHPAKGDEAVRADALRKRPESRSLRRDIGACLVQEGERSLRLVVGNTVGHDDERPADLRPLAAEGVSLAALLQGGHGFTPPSLVASERTSDREPSRFGDRIVSARSAVFVGAQERGACVLPLAPHPAGVRGLDPDHRQEIVLERLAALGRVYALGGEHRQVPQRGRPSPHLEQEQMAPSTVGVVATSGIRGYGARRGTEERQQEQDQPKHGFSLQGQLSARAPLPA